MPTSLEKRVADALREANEPTHEAHWSDQDRPDPLTLAQRAQAPDTSESVRADMWRIVRVYLDAIGEGVSQGRALARYYTALDVGVGDWAHCTARAFHAYRPDVDDRNALAMTRADVARQREEHAPRGRARRGGRSHSAMARRR